MKFYLVNLNSSEYFEISDKLSVGRKDSCSLVVKDDLVSGRHCRFHLSGRLIFIEDLNASNPIQINNQQVASNAKVKLKNKDKIKIGSIEYYLSNRPPEGDEERTYKSVVLEKVKIHETFESDFDYAQNEKHWGKQVSTPYEERNSRLKNKNSSLSPQENRSPKKESPIEKVDTDQSLSKVSQNISDVAHELSTLKKYTPDEIDEKKSFYAEKIEYYAEKRREVLKIESLQKQLLELEELKIALEKRD